MKYIKYRDNEKKFSALTGFTHEHFKELLPHFEGRITAISVNMT
jgi:hypothetical protein